MDGMGGMGGDTEFGRLIQQAAKLKGHQMKQDRKRYEVWPQYLQHTMYNEPMLKEIHDLPFAERMAKAVEFKTEGNEMFKTGRLDDAMSTYEKALGVVRFVHNRESEWKTKGIKDEDVSIVDFKGETEAEKAEVLAYKISVLNNLAICSRKMHQLNLAIQGHSDVLELDCLNVKALFGRSTAYEMMGSATEFDLAIKDMRAASEIEPKHLKKYRTMAAEKKKQKQTESATFGGWASRGSIYKDGEMPSATTEEAKAAETRAPGSYNSMAEVEEDMNKMKDAITAAEYAGNRPEAAMLKKKLAGVQKTIDDAKARAIEKAKKAHAESLPDWSEPSVEMIADAAKFDLDITDPDVRAELIRVSKEHAAGRDPMAEPPAVGGGGWCGWLRGSGSGRSMRFALIGGLVAVLLAGWRVQHWAHVLGSMGSGDDAAAAGAAGVGGGPLGQYDAMNEGVNDEPWEAEGAGTTDDLDW